MGTETRKLLQSDFTMFRMNSNDLKILAMVLKARKQTTIAHFNFKKFFLTYLSFYNRFYIHAAPDRVKYTLKVHPPKTGFFFWGGVWNIFLSTNPMTIIFLSTLRTTTKTHFTYLEHGHLTKKNFLTTVEKKVCTLFSPFFSISRQKQ